MTRLDEFDKDEWHSIARALKPGLTQAEYDDMWERFQREKAERERQRGLN